MDYAVITEAVDFAAVARAVILVAGTYAVAFVLRKGFDMLFKMVGR